MDGTCGRDGLARDCPAEEVDQPHLDQSDQPDPDPLRHEGRWSQVEQRLWLVNSDGSNNRKPSPLAGKRQV